MLKKQKESIIFFTAIFLLFQFVPEFVLAADEDVKFSFAIISDTHNSKQCGITQGKWTAYAVKKINSLKPDFVVGLGDLIAGGGSCGGNTSKDIPAQWAEFKKKVLTKIDAPLVPIAGNHDMKTGSSKVNEEQTAYVESNWDKFWNDNKSEVLSLAANADGYPNSYRFEYKGQGFSFIDYPGHWGVSQAGINWINGNVSSGDLVFYHVNPYGVSCFKTGNYCGFAIRHNDVHPKTFLAALQAKGIKALFSGHTHSFYDGVCTTANSSIRFINTGTLGLRSLSYLQGQSTADIRESFVWVDVLENGNIKVTFYVYEGGKFVKFDNAKFPEKIETKEQNRSWGFHIPNLDSSKEGVNAVCVSNREGATTVTADTGVPFINEVKLILQQPMLQIKIPGLDFTDPDKLQKVTEAGNQFLLIPYLGEYIAGIYKYSVAVVGIVAAVIIIFAGVRWVMSAGNAEKIAESRKKISAALIGLVIAVGSYSALYLINPELVNFRNLKVLIVKGQPLDLLDIEGNEENRDSYPGGFSASSGPPNDRTIKVSDPENFCFPVTNGFVRNTKNWGQARKIDDSSKSTNGKKMRCHSGVDIITDGKNKRGTVVSMTDGVVLRVLRGTSEGKVAGQSKGAFYTCGDGATEKTASGEREKVGSVEVWDSVHNMTYMYGELNAGSMGNIKRGDKVSKGQKIGVASKCMMLHLEIYQGKGLRYQMRGEKKQFGEQNNKPFYTNGWALFDELNLPELDWGNRACSKKPYIDILDFNGSKLLDPTNLLDQIKNNRC